jgi:hypothetical protein
MKPIILFLFAVLFLTNCSNPSEVVKADENPANELEMETALPSAEVNNQPPLEPVIETKDEDSIKGIKGLIVLSEEGEKSKDFIHFYNEEGSLWYEFTFYYEDKDGKFEYENSEFRVFAFHPDYHVLALKLVSEDSNRYQVIVNEETGLIKYVKKTDKNLKFETLEEYVLSMFAVGFNEKENPIIESPKGKTKKTITYKKDNVFFFPIEIKGEWLKIKWDIKDNPNKYVSDFGWIRWRNKDKLLIELFNFA